MANKIIILIVILGIVFSICGCTETQEKEEIKENETVEQLPTAPEFASAEEEATTKCMEECKSRKDTEDFSRGPCLSNEIAPDWVCDVAHKPRQSVDNEPENQCSAVRERKAHHFVELDPNCSVIKVY